VTAKQRVVNIPEYQPEGGIDGYGRKKFEPMNKRMPHMKDARADT